jgi:hypothetical protein
MTEGLRHLLGIDGLGADEIVRVLDTAEAFFDVSLRRVRKVPTLRGKTVINLFYEASTRTRTSFELAGKTPLRRRDQHLLVGQLGVEGRVAPRHGEESGGHAPRRDRRAAHALRRGALRGEAHPRGRGQRRRRHARAPHPGAPRRIHHPPREGTHRGPHRRHRGRHRALSGGPLQRPPAHRPRRDGARLLARVRCCPPTWSTWAWRCTTASPRPSTAPTW